MGGDSHEPVAGGVQHAEHLSYERGPAAAPGARVQPLNPHARRQAPNRRRGQGGGRRRELLIVSTQVEKRRGEREDEGYGHRRRGIGRAVTGRGEGEMGEDVGCERLHRVTGGVEERTRGPFLGRRRRGCHVLHGWSSGKKKLKGEDYSCLLLVSSL